MIFHLSKRPSVEKILLRAYKMMWILSIFLGDESDCVYSNAHDLRQPNIDIY